MPEYTIEPAPLRMRYRDAKGRPSCHVKGHDCDWFTCEESTGPYCEMSEQQLHVRDDTDYPSVMPFFGFCPMWDDLKGEELIDD